MVLLSSGYAIDTSMDIRKLSFDITDPRSDSPAPTYSSTFHSEQDDISPPHLSKPFHHPFHQDCALGDEKPSQPIAHQHLTSAYEKRSPTTNNNGIFSTLEEPHDTNHPHYMPPAEAPSFASIPTTNPPKKRRRLALKVVLPWALALLFFLISLWYTSIALGVRFLTILHPAQSEPPSINIQIIGQPFAGTPSFAVSTAGTGLPPLEATSGPLPSSTSAARNDNQGIESDSNDDTSTFTIQGQTAGVPSQIGTVEPNTTDISRTTLITMTKRAAGTDI